MPTTPDESWINIFTAKIQNRYDDKGWFLPQFMTPAAIDGANLYWHKITGDFDAFATTRKSRYAQHTFAGLDHEMVSVSTSDNELALMIERLDTLRTNIDFQNSYLDWMYDKMGQVVDAKGITEFNANKNATILGPAPGLATTAKSAAADLDLTYIQQMRETFDENRLPADGRYLLVSPAVWSLLERLPEFSNADYIGYDAMPFKRQMQMKPFQTFTVVQWTELPVTPVKDDGSAWVSGVDAANLLTGRRNHCMALHRDCMGYGETGGGLFVDIGWERTYSGWAMVMQMSNGFHVIDDRGVYEFTVDTLSNSVSVPQWPSV
jgi:hypothetical protein